MYMATRVGVIRFVVFFYIYLSFSEQLLGVTTHVYPQLRIGHTRNKTSHAQNKSQLHLNNYLLYIGKRCL